MPNTLTIELPFCTWASADRRGASPSRSYSVCCGRRRWLPSPEELLDLDGALQTLEAELPRAARIMELRFFLGYSTRKAAEILGVTLATAKKDRQVAKGLLYVRLNEPRLLFKQDEED